MLAILAMILDTDNSVKMNATDVREIMAQDTVMKAEDTAMKVEDTVMKADIMAMTAEDMVMMDLVLMIEWSWIMLLRSLKNLWKIVLTFQQGSIKSLWYLTKSTTEELTKQEI